MHGLTGFFLGGVRPSEELVVDAFHGGQEQSAGGRRRCQMDVPLLVFGCRAWLASVVVIVGRWSPVALVCGLPVCQWQSSVAWSWRSCSCSLSGLVSVCGRRRWSLEPSSAGR
jgi:hypothetical protein